MKEYILPENITHANVQSDMKPSVQECSLFSYGVSGDDIIYKLTNNVLCHVRLAKSVQNFIRKHVLSYSFANVTQHPQVRNILHQ